MTSSETFEAPDPEELSMIIPGFSVGALVATSEDSAVYSAVQTSLERQVALRVFSPAASSDPDRMSRVEATTRAMARLKHRNLIGLFDSGTREGMMYIVMEFVAGKPLARSLTGGPVHHEQVKSIITSVCEGLAHAHQNHIVHGNLSADDILLNQDAEPKIGGFQGGDFEETYVADIVAVGRLLYLMLTGVEDVPRSVEPSVLAGSPPELDEIWLRSVRRDRADAFTSVQEMLEALTTPQKKATSAVRKAQPPRGPVPRVSRTPSTATLATKRSHWPLLRNLVLIVVLIIAILKVWGIIQQKEREALQKQAEDQKQAEEQQKQDQEARQKRTSRQPKNKPDKLVDEIRDAPLAEIRTVLASGGRDVMPIGSVRRGDSAYLLVRDLYTWPEACWFAERHGAHLAIVEQSSDLAWFQAMAGGESFWLGAGKSGRSGREAWRLVDGNPWHPTKEPAGLGRYLAVDKDGSLRAAGDQVRLVCILQWRMDGSNPGQLERLLTAAADALARGDSAYPPGTDLLADKAYLVVARDVKWKEAKALAESAGGHLASASNPTEILYLQDMARNFPTGKPHWMGARRTNAGWAWETGDTWREMRISGVAEKIGMALAVSSDGGWQALPESDKAAGFVIEWAGQGAKGKTGKDPAPDKPATNSGSTISDSINALDTQAKRLIQTESDKQSRDLKANVSKMRSDLDLVLRKMNKTTRQDWEEDVNDLKQKVEGNRLPKDIESLDITFNEDLAKVCAYAANKQMTIDAEFTASTNKVREAYQKKLRDIMAKVKEQGEKEAVPEVEEKLDAAKELKPWLEELGFDQPDEISE